MKYKPMREMTHEEFLDNVKDMTEEEMLDFSANYGGYPVFFRMALPEVLTHKFPLIQNGSAIIIVNENGQILLQERTDRNKFGLPGGVKSQEKM